MKLEFPLNDALPSTDHARDRLLAKVFNYRRDEKVVQATSDEDYGLLYAYGDFFVIKAIIHSNKVPHSFSDRTAFQRNQGDWEGDRKALWCS